MRGSDNTERAQGSGVVRGRDCHSPAESGEQTCCSPPPPGQQTHGAGTQTSTLAPTSSDRCDGQQWTPVDNSRPAEEFNLTRFIKICQYCEDDRTKL